MWVPGPVWTGAENLDPTGIRSPDRPARSQSLTFPIKNCLKQGKALSPLLFNFALQYVIRRVEVKQEELKLNGTHQLLVHADVSILNGNVYTIKKNGGLVIASKETDLEVNADKTKYMVMSRDQNAGQNHNITTHNKISERMEHFKFWEQP